MNRVNIEKIINQLVIRNKGKVLEALELSNINISKNTPNDVLSVN